MLPTCFQDFIRERKYLKNVSPRTIQWYEESFAWLSKFELTEAGLKEFVIAMRDAGLKPTSCNSRIRVANAYLAWAKSPLRVGKLKESREVLPVFSQEMLDKLISFKPRKWHEKRLHAIVCVQLDCGLRIDECLSIRRVDVDLDNLLLKVHGKGDQQRIVPLSYEARKVVYQWCREHEFSLVFPTAHGTKLGRRDVLRDLKKLCRRLGFEPPRRTLHALRHTFSLEYIRAGGGEFRLQKMLGHSTLTMTRRYVALCVSDLQAVKQQTSLLARR